MPSHVIFSCPIVSHHQLPVDAHSSQSNICSPASGILLSLLLITFPLFPR